MLPGLQPRGMADGSKNSADRPKQLPMDTDVGINDIRMSPKEKSASQNHLHDPQLVPSFGRRIQHRTCANSDRSLVDFELLMDE